jgi:hypothetical protein
VTCRITKRRHRPPCLARDEAGIRYGPPISTCIASMGRMKTTVDIQDQLLRRAKAEAKRGGTTLRALIEEGLRLVLEEPAEHYELPDRSVGVPGADNPLQRMSWQDLRREIYGTEP